MIGIFDSGFGGVSILREIRKAFPDYSILYLGDSARNPYGAKSPEQVRQMTYQGVRYLEAMGAQLIIIACNTACAHTLHSGGIPPVNVPVFDVIVPTALEAAQHTQGRIGVIATRSTINSHIYEEVLSSIIAEHHDLRIIEQACPLFVPLIEEGWERHFCTRLIAEKYLKPLKGEDIDTLILGCTHYPFLERTIRSIMGSKVRIITSGLPVVNALRAYLLESPEAEAALVKHGDVQYCATDNLDIWARFIRVHAPFPHTSIEKVSIG